jgi:hypothetical protein
VTGGAIPGGWETQTKEDELRQRIVALEAQLAAVPLDAIAIALSDGVWTTGAGRKARLIVWDWLRSRP